MFPYHDSTDAQASKQNREDVCVPYRAEQGGCMCALPRRKELFNGTKKTTVAFHMHNGNPLNAVYS